MDSIGRAYGAGLAGGAFDPVQFFRKPAVILRIISWVFSIIIFGCISAGGYYGNNGSCKFSNSGACGWGIFVGVLAFLACIAFLFLDAKFEQISSVQQRKHAVLADVAGSAVGTFLMFVTFCVLVDKWRNNSAPAEALKDRDNPQAAIAFSFFSIFTWAGLTFFAWRRYQEGAANAFAPSYEQDLPGGATPYDFAGGPGPEIGGKPYQEPPFAASNNASSMPQYQQPAY